MNNQGSSRNMILVGVIAVAAILLLAPRLFGGNDTVDNTPRDTDTRTESQTVDDGIDLGRIVVAENVDRDGCPVDTTTNLSSTDMFYVVAAGSEVAEGTDIFVRLYQDGQAVEDLPIITANQDYDNTCINFVFETTDGFDFERGDYEAEFWVNGNSYDSISFEIR